MLPPRGVNVLPVDSNRELQGFPTRLARAGTLLFGGFHLRRSDAIGSGRTLAACLFVSCAVSVGASWRFTCREGNSVLMVSLLLSFQHSIFASIPLFIFTDLGGYSTRLLVKLGLHSLPGHTCSDDHGIIVLTSARILNV